MNLQKRNNVHITGDGVATLILSHGFGCDQSMWKFLLPHFAKSLRVITYDLVGAGRSELNAYDREKYASLIGYASDLNEIIHEYAVGPVIIVGHSVSAMIAALADIQLPGRISGLVMIGGSPCYIDSDSYNGGFSESEVQSLLATIDENYLGWSSTMAPVLMGAREKAPLTEELLSSFCRTDADIARHFARVIFLSDHRAELAKVNVPTLILQCSRDPVVPVAVGEYMHSILPGSSLVVVENIGHYPHLSAPGQCSAAIDDFLGALGLTHG